MQLSNIYTRFKFRWLDLNNAKMPICGIHRSRRTVRFEIGRKIPGTDKFAEIFNSGEMKQPHMPDFSFPLQTMSLQ